MFVVEIKPPAIAEMKRLDRQVCRRIDGKILGLSTNPRPPGCKKLRVSGMENVFRIRMGDFRVIYHVDDFTSLVSVLHIRHRREAYRNL